MQNYSKRIEVAKLFLSDTVHSMSDLILMRHVWLQDPNDNSILDMLIGYSCMQIRILLSSSLLLLLLLLLWRIQSFVHFVLDTMAIDAEEEIEI